VASVPAPGPVDLVEEGVNGAIDDQLMRACLRGLRCSREKARASILGRTLRAGREVFRAHLVPMAPDGAAERFSPAPPAVSAGAAAVL